MTYIKEELRVKLNEVEYDPKKEPPPFDVFGPLTKESEI